MSELNIADRQQISRWVKNRAENSHQLFRRREWALLRLRWMKTLQPFTSTHAVSCNPFNQEPHVTSRNVYNERRSATLAEWISLVTQCRRPGEMRPSGDQFDLD